MFENLELEMFKMKLSDKDLAKTINSHVRTFKNKKNGVTEFTLKDMNLIRNKYFPTSTLDYLFETKKETVE